MSKRLFAVGKRMGGRSYVRAAGGDWIEVKATVPDAKAR